jgi:4-amino-4-deoxy-L-arabinose transferase-like glycosyltransferase
LPAYGEHPRPFPRALFLLLGLSLLLNVIGIGWGLPSLNGWAMDEIIPAKVQDGIAQHFSHGWHSKYPPLHYYVLSLTHLPFLLLERLHLLKVEGYFTVYTWLFFLGRLISVLMATAIVFLVYLCGCELFERRAALFAALITATMGAFVYYAKITNVDVPYIFWFVFSLVFYARILKRHLLHDYLLFAVTAVCAVCSKDQAYGLYVLTPIPIVLSQYFQQKTKDSAVKFRHVLLARKNLLAVGTAGLLFMLIHNVVFNLSGFLGHVAQIIGPASKGFQLYPNTAAGHGQMLWQAIKHLQFLFGWPMFVVCLVGVAAAAVRKERNLLLFAMLVPGISYYLFFISVVLYHYERFLIPVAILLAFFGGKVLADCCTAHWGWYWGKKLLLSLLIGYSLWYAASVDINMANDSRYYVENWMKDHIDRNATIGLIGFWECLPRTTNFKHVGFFFPPSAETIRAAKPEYLVINPAITFGETDFYERFGLEELGYALALQYRTPRKWVLFDYETILKNGREYLYSNLDKINPEIKIYRLVERTDKKQ